MSADFSQANFNDLQRDAWRYYQLLIALNDARRQIGIMEQEGSVDLDGAFQRLMPEVAEALAAEQAFVARLQADEQTGEAWLVLLAAHPREELRGQRLERDGILAEILRRGEYLVADPLGDPEAAVIPGLELFGATQVVLARVASADRVYVVGACNKLDPDDVFLAADGMALKNILELIAFGARVGEQRLRELETIQATSADISAELDLDHLLPSIAASAARIFSAPATSLMLWDEAEENLVIVASQGLSPTYVDGQHIARDRVLAAVDRARDPRCLVTPDLRTAPYGQPDLIEAEGLCSALSTTLLVAGEIIGILNIYSRGAPREFSPDECELAEIFANQAAIAIRNAELYQRAQQKSEHLEALYEAAKAITAGFGEEQKQVLDRITEQAVTRITGNGAGGQVWGAIMLYDRESVEMRLESAYPARVLEALETSLGRRWSLDRALAPGGRIGITGRTVLEEAAQRVDDVRLDPDCLPFNPDSRSQVSVPLFDDGEVIGALSVESDEVGAFDGEDERALLGLAELAMVAIKSAQQATKWKRAHAMALLGAWGAEMAHQIHREVGKIRLAVSSLQGLGTLPAGAADLVETIGRSAGRLAIPPIPEHPPTPGEAAEPAEAPLDEVLGEMIDALQRELEATHSPVDLQADLRSGPARVGVHPYWLARMTHHLVQNAIRAAASNEPGDRVLVESRLLDDGAEIAVEDAGGGIPPDVEPLLFAQPIFRNGERPGIGLLLVHYIAETYGGSVRLAWNRPGEGSRFVLRLPLAAAPDPEEGP